MREASTEAIILIIDYDPTALIKTFIGRSPIEFIDLITKLVQPVRTRIEKSQPDKYEARGEVHQAIWLKTGRDECELAESVFKLLLDLTQELERFNVEVALKGLQSAMFHAGLGEGKVDVNLERAAGDGLKNTFALAGHARKVGAILASTKAISGRVRFLKNGNVGLSVTDNQLQSIDFGKPELLAMANALH